MVAHAAPNRRLPETPALLLVRTPRRVRRLGRLVMYAFLIVVPTLLLAPWTQTVHGAGRAIAFDPVRRPQPIISPIQGRIMKWYVKEGDRVKAGDKLVDLVDNDPRRLEVLREQLLLADQRRTLARSMVSEQESRLKFVQAEAPLRIAQAKARADAAEAALPLAQQEMLRAKADEARSMLAYNRQLKIFETPVAGFAQGGALSKDQLEETERQMTLAKERIPLVQAQIRVAEKQFAAAKEEANAVEQQTLALVQAERLALAARQSELQSTDQQYLSIRSEVFRQENQFITASTNGTIFRVLANAEAGGQLVNPGAQLATLVPELGAQPLTDGATPGIVAELLIDGNDLPLVRKGDRTVVQFEGWAAVQFAAYPDAAAGTFEGRVYLVDPTSDGNGRFRVLVEPAPGVAWPEESFLRQGVRAQGWILVGEVRLGYEMWRLLNGFPPIREVKSKEPRQVFGTGPVVDKK